MPQCGQAGGNRIQIAQQKIRHKAHTGKAVCPAVCGDQKTEKLEGVHEHEWANPVTTKDPTCSEEGEVTFYCSCGETTKAIVRPSGDHKWNSQNVCTVCGDIKPSASPPDIG